MSNTEVLLQLVGTIVVFYLPLVLLGNLIGANHVFW